MSHARASMLHRRPVQRFVAAGAVVALASGLATLEALAAEPEEESSDIEVRTVRVTDQDEIDLFDDRDEGLAGVVGEALEARQQLVAAEPEPEPEPDPEPESEPEPEPEVASEPEPAPAPAPEPSHEGSVDVATWDRLAQCESGGNWSIDTGNGFYGGLQFTVDSWRAVGGSGMPHEASKQEQINRAERLLAKQGWGAWPSCSSQLGLR